MGAKLTSEDSEIRVWSMVVTETTTEDIRTRVTQGLAGHAEDTGIYPE